MASRLIPEPFTYPQEAHERRHGPGGWKDYRQYRPWLRDEFDFRCVLCLIRERWIEMRRAFPVDHFEPRAVRPDLAHEYTNLLYLCPNCNSVKSDSLIPDPCKIALATCLKVHPNGDIQPLNPDGERLIYELALDDPTLTDYRRRMMQILRTVAEVDWAQFVDWMRFPDDLVDLTAFEPPYNTTPDGVTESWFAKRRRGELPEVY